MDSHSSPHAAPKKSKILRNILFLLVAVIVLIALYYHLQNPILVLGGAVTVILAHLAIAGGAAHIIPILMLRFHGELAEPNPPDDSL